VVHWIGNVIPCDTCECRKGNCNKYVTCQNIFASGGSINFACVDGTANCVNGNCEAPGSGALDESEWKVCGKPVLDILAADYCLRYTFSECQGGTSTCVVDGNIKNHVITATIVFDV